MAIILLAIVGILLIGVGLIQYSFPQKTEEIILEKAEDNDDQTIANEATVIVDIAGAVQQPGVYTMSKDARLQDVVVAAGGLHSDVSTEAVAKQLNLAAKVTDGQKIYIPFEGEEQQLVLQAAVAGSSTSLININSASASELDTLSGVGPVTAEKIISNRPYASLEELVSKKALGQSVFEKIKESLIL
jgi:competence protein ComEA